MSALVSALFLLPTQAAAPDPNRLPIGPKGERTVEVGKITDLRSGKAVTAKDIAEAARGKRFVFLGENHATAPHQQLEADVIQALVADGREVVVGMEMITRPKQGPLDLWSAGKLEEADFLSQVDWKGQWGYDFGFYRPVLNAVKQNHLPLVALNVPRDWVRTVGRGGFAALSTEQRLQLPPALGQPIPEHRQVFDSLMGGHPVAGQQGENMYAAQVLWDEGMADTALKFLDRMPTSSKTVFVVIAGSGHVMYGQGINARIEKRGGGKGITVVMTQSATSPTVSRGLADFVYVSTPSEK